MNAQELIEKIGAASPEQLACALCDGALLSSIGITDSKQDQEQVELLHAFVVGPFGSTLFGANLIELVERELIGSFVGFFDNVINTGIHNLTTDYDGYDDESHAYISDVFREVAQDLIKPINIRLQK